MSPTTLPPTGSNYLTNSLRLRCRSKSECVDFPRCPTTAPMDARIYHLCRDPVAIFGPTRLDLTSDTGYTGGQFWIVDCGSVQVLRCHDGRRCSHYDLSPGCTGCARHVETAVSTFLFEESSFQHKRQCSHFSFCAQFSSFWQHTHYILLF